MTLSFSPFSIQDILTGRDARGKPGGRSAEGHCAPKRNGRAEDPDPSHQGAEEERIQSGRLPADPSLSDTCSEESTREESEHRDQGEKVLFGWRERNLRTNLYIATHLRINCQFRLFPASDYIFHKSGILKWDKVNQKNKMK